MKAAELNNSKAVGRNITLQQIRIFLQAVNTRNFSKVAQVMNFTPSMVSKNIQAMEEELGLTLFIRRPHELSPTPQAELLARELRQLLGSFDNAVLKARNCQNGETSTVFLGFVDSSPRVDAFIRETIREYQAQCPEVRILAEKHDMHRSVELVDFGILDLSITNEMEVPYLEEHEIPWEKLSDTDVMAFVPAGNKLFARESIDFEDLKNASLIALDPKMHPGYDSWLYELCSSYGFLPHIETSFRTVRSLMFNLELQNRIFIGDSITSDWCNDKLKGFALPAKSYALIAYRRDAGSEVLKFKEFLIKNYN